MAAQVLKVILFLSPYYIYLTSANNYSNSLLCGYHDNCLCPEDTLTFTCSVGDGAGTIWKGSIFNCGRGSKHEILLRHSIFDEYYNNSETCNDGTIVAYSTEFELINNSYISQLNVTISPEMHSGTIECIQLSFSAVESSVGTCTLILATGKHSKHSHVYLNAN